MTKIHTQDIESIVNAKKLFKSCYDEDKIEIISEAKVLNYTLNLGGWPLLNNMYTNNSDMNSILNLMHSLFKIGINPLFNLYVSSLPSNPRQSIIQIGQANWFLYKDYYDDFNNTVPIYKKMIIKIAKLMNSTNVDLEKDVDDLFNLEKQLAKNTLTQEQRRRSTFKQITLKELNQQIPYVNTEFYFIFS